MKLYLTAFIQVFLVACNTIFLAQGNWFGIAFMSFFISWFWVGNVKKANIANTTQRAVYSLGAMSGGLSGYLFTKLIDSL